MLWLSCIRAWSFFVMSFPAPTRSRTLIEGREGIWYLVSGILHRPNSLSDCQWV